jgi:hypothetical protein
MLKDEIEKKINKSQNEFNRKKKIGRWNKRKTKKQKKGPQPNISTLKSLDSTPCLTCV